MLKRKTVSIHKQRVDSPIFGMLHAKFHLVFFSAAPLSFVCFNRILLPYPYYSTNVFSVRVYMVYISQAVTEPHLERNKHAAYLTHQTRHTHANYHMYGIFTLVCTFGTTAQQQWNEHGLTNDSIQPRYIYAHNRTFFEQQQQPAQTQAHVRLELPPNTHSVCVSVCQSAKKRFIYAAEFFPFSVTEKNFIAFQFDRNSQRRQLHWHF